MATRLMRNIALATTAYCVTAFALAVAIYVILMTSDNALLRDPATGAPVQAIIPPSTILVSAVLFGAMTTFYSSGGLLGVWLLASRCSNNILRQVAGSAVFALIGSGILVLGTSLGDDHLAVRALGIAALSVGVALIVIVYAPASRQVTTG